jgi:hypothetical protein
MFHEWENTFKGMIDHSSIQNPLSVFMDVPLQFKQTTGFQLDRSPETDCHCKMLILPINNF